jgi:tRNA(Ile)-lysidine synthase TilS/MesJ
MKNSLQDLSISCYTEFLLKINSGYLLICCLSGGQDSQLIFYLFLHLRKHLNFNILYCHHFWQLLNFTAFWELWKNSYLFQIPFYFFVTERQFVTEERARNWRTENLAHLSNFHFDPLTNRFANFSLGHTASDQIETCIHKLSRGTSPASLASFNRLTSLKKPIFDLKFQNQNRFWVKTHSQNIKFSYSKIKLKNIQQSNKSTKFIKKFNSIRNFIDLKKISGNIYKYEEQSSFSTKVLRPLIFYHRQDITKIIKNNKLPVTYDPTNQNYKWTRNKLRQKVLPLIRGEVTNIFDFHFSKFLLINEGEQIFLKKIRNKLFQVNFSKHLFKNLPEPIQKQVIHDLINYFSFRQSNSEQIDMILRKIS